MAFLEVKYEDLAKVFTLHKPTQNKIKIELYFTRHAKNPYLKDRFFSALLKS